MTPQPLKANETSWRYTNLKIEFCFDDIQNLRFWVIKMTDSCQWTYVWASAQNDISEDEQTRIINTSKECVRQFGLSVEKRGEQEEESELLLSVENFRRELNLLLISSNV